MTDSRMIPPPNTGRVIKLSQCEARTLMNFQRSAYAKQLREILLKVLDDERTAYETQPAAEETRQRVKAVKDMIDLLFSSRVELR